jgi:hypothetical protein
MTTQAFRRGWRDGFDAAPSQEGSYAKGTFASHDYREGYEAGQSQSGLNVASALVDYMLVAGRNPASKRWPDHNSNVVEIRTGVWSNRHD